MKHETMDSEKQTEGYRGEEVGGMGQAGDGQ